MLTLTPQKPEVTYLSPHTHTPQHHQHQHPTPPTPGSNLHPRGCSSALLPMSHNGISPIQVFMFLFFFFFPLAFFGWHSRHTEVPRLGNQSLSHWPTPQTQQHQVRSVSATYTTVQGNARSFTH